MFTTLLLPRGSASKVTAHTGPMGSIVFNTDTVTIHLQDGATPGGIAVSKVGHAHASGEVVSWLGYTPAALGVDGKVLPEQLPDNSGGGSGPANISLSAGSQGAAYNNVTGVLDLSGLSSTAYDLAALIDATSQHLTVIVGGTLKASVFSGNGAGLTHLAADQLTSGFVSQAVLGSGTADDTTFLRGDGTWATIGAGGGLVASDIINALGYTPASLVNGSVPSSELSLTSTDVSEGSRLYWTSARSRNSISLVTGTSGATYDVSTGILDMSALNYPAITDTQIKNSLGYTPAALDVNNKLLISQIPAIAITDTYVVASESAMLGLTAQTGDVAIRTDLQMSFILQSSPATTLSNWQELLSPTAAVASVNGYTGPVVLATGDLAESGGNLFFTNARARAAVSVNAGTTGVTYNATTGVFDLAPLAATSAIIQAVAAIPSFDGSTSGLYGGLNGTKPQLFFVNQTAPSGGRTWGMSVGNGGAISLASYDDAGATAAFTYLTANPTNSTVTLGLAAGVVTVPSATVSFTGSGGLSVTNGVTASSFAGAGSNLTALNASALASGTVPSARLGTGTASNSTILYGDGVWRVAPGSGTVSSVNGHTTATIVLTTDDIGEGSTNLYFSQTRARLAVSLTAGSSGITYNSSTGVIDASGIAVGLTTVNGVTGSSGSVTITTAAINEGGSNFYFTNTRARAAISLTAGTTGATYNSTTGVLDLSQLQGTTGTVTTISVASANGVSGSVANPTTTPVITIALGAIVPSSVNASGNVTGATVTSTGTLTASGNLNLSGTLSGGTISGTRINPRSGSVNTGTSFTPPSDTTDFYEMTSLPSNFTVANPSGTPVKGQKLLLLILDNGTSRTISWGTAYRAVGITLPTSTIANKTMYVGCVWNATNATWDAIAMSQQA
jgi:hypothetical protein